MKEAKLITFGECRVSSAHLLQHEPRGSQVEVGPRQGIGRGRGAPEASARDGRGGEGGGCLAHRHANVELFNSISTQTGNKFDQKMMITLSYLKKSIARGKL
jgi:hypothetical protein